MSKFCVNCGAELKDGGDICLKCGKLVNGESAPASTTITSDNAVATKTNSLAVAGFIVSLCSLIINFGGIVGAVGTILSSIGLAKLKKNNEKGFGLALTGIIVGAFSIIYGIWSIINLVNTVNYYL